MNFRHFLPERGKFLRLQQGLSVDYEIRLYMFRYISVRILVKAVFPVFKSLCDPPEIQILLLHFREHDRQRIHWSHHCTVAEDHFVIFPARLPAHIRQRCLIGPDVQTFVFPDNDLICISFDLFSSCIGKLSVADHDQPFQ